MAYTLRPPPHKLYPFIAVFLSLYFIWRLISAVAGLIGKLVRLLPPNIRNVFLKQQSEESKHATLVTIIFSHFCEKARFALDLSKGFENYKEQAHMSFFHLIYSFWNTSGTYSGTPLLVTRSGEVIRDSSAILHHISERAGNDWLYPAAQKAEIEELEGYLDKRFGPAVRVVAYYHLLADHNFLEYERFFKQVPCAYDWQKRGFLSVMPYLVFLKKMLMKIEPKNYEKQVARVDETFDRINALLSDGRSYLMNTPHPTAADITFAALSYCLIAPPQLADVLGYKDSAKDVGADMAAEIARRRNNLAGKFVLRMYAVHRQSMHLHIATASN